MELEVLTWIIFLAICVVAAHNTRTPPVDPRVEHLGDQAWESLDQAVYNQLPAIAPYAHRASHSEVWKYVLQAELQNASLASAIEGTACSWKVYKAAAYCITNWNDLNQTIQPANQLAQASVNFLAKQYACSSKPSTRTCTAVNHCKWLGNPMLSGCFVTGFFQVLQYACHDSLMNQVAICIDHPAHACRRDPRCYWRIFRGVVKRDVCLPNTIPKTWTAVEVYHRLADLQDMTNQTQYVLNWGDCLTSQAWYNMTHCYRHSLEQECTADSICLWNEALGICQLDPEQHFALAWGDDHKTVEVIADRDALCLSHSDEKECLTADDNSSTSRSLKPPQ